MEENKEKNINNDKESKALIKKEKKKEKGNFIQKIKKQWLVDNLMTFVIVLFIISILVGINTLVSSFELVPIDFSQEGLFSLTDESKERVASIEKDVNIYFVGYKGENSTIDLARQYSKPNEKIKVEVINEASRPDIVQKYKIETGMTGIIIECGKNSKVLTDYDLISQDQTTGESVSIAEEVFTSSIVSVTTDEIPKTYFLEGYSNFSLNTNLYYLGMFMANEINEIDTINPLSTGNIPEDCDVLVINTPIKDFDDVTTKAINDYINRGGNILWLNAAISKQTDFTNVNSILANYGISPFSTGIIRETNSNNMYSGSPDIIFPNPGYSEVTKNSPEVLLVTATKINVNNEKLAELKVVKNDIYTTSENAYFRTDFNIKDNNKVEGEEEGSFTVATEMVKTIKDENVETGEKAVESKMIIFGENTFISDYVVMQNSQYPAIQLGYNKNLALDSIAYLAERKEDIEARESIGTVKYTATETQDIIIRVIIFAVPALIILIGIIVWIVRRRRK